MSIRSFIFLVALCFCKTASSQFDFGTSQPVGQPNTVNPNTNTFVPKYDEASINHIISVVHQVEQSENFINLGGFSPDSNVALPFGIIKDIGAVRYIIAVDSLKFKSTGAYFSCYSAIDFPGTTKKIAFNTSVS